MEDSDVCGGTGWSWNEEKNCSHAHEKPGIVLIDSQGTVGRSGRVSMY